MSKVINLMIVFALMIGVISSPTIVVASCAQEPIIGNEIVTSKVIFVGEVIGVKKEREFKIQFSPFSIFPPKKSILFEVQNTWKGVSQSQIIIDTYDGKLKYDFKVGHEYLVYAKQSNFKRLATNICDATKELASAEQDLILLGAGKLPAEDVNLQDTFNNNPLYMWISLIGITLIVLFFLWRRTKLKPIYGIVFYFSAIFLLSYYFVGVSFIKSLQMASLITILHILIDLLKRLYWKNRTNRFKW